MKYVALLLASIVLAASIFLVNKAPLSTTSEVTIHTKAPMKMLNDDVEQAPEVVNKGTEIVTDEQQCLSKLDESLLERLNQKYQEDVTELFSIHDNYSGVDMDHIANLAGLDVAKTRLVRLGFPKHKVGGLNDFEPKGKQLNPDVRIKIAKLIKQRDYLALANYLTERDLINNVSLGPQTLLSAILRDNPSISADDVALLHSIGLNPNLIELEYLTTAGADGELLAKFELSGQDLPLTVWQEDNRLTSLAVVASENFNYKALNYWLSIGVTGEPEEYYNNALDMLPTPSNQKERDAAINIVRQLMTHQIYPSSVFSFNKLKAWLPSDVINDYHQQLNFHLASGVNDMLLTEASILKQELIQLTQAYNQNINCGFEQSSANSLTFSNKGYASPAQIVRPERDLDRLVEAEEKLNTSLASSDLSEHEQRSLKEFTKLLMTSTDASEVLEQAELLDKEFGTDEHKNMALILALQRGAPFAEIKELLEAGAELPVDTIHMLAIGDKANLASKLLPYGLRLQVSTAELPPILNTVVEFQAKKMLSFLLSYDTDINKVKNGYEQAITLALRKFIKGDGDIWFVATLVDSGALLSEADNSLLKQAKQYSPKQYQSLVDTIL